MKSIHKIVVASDSFKGSLTSSGVARAVESGIRDIFPECEVTTVEIADGGEGTSQAVLKMLGGEKYKVTVHDPIGRLKEATYLICVIDGTRTAVIETAEASGLTLLAPEERNPLITSTYGTGEMIMHAYGQGCRKFIIGLGGSATNDGGTGMLEAMGFRFIDKNNNAIERCCGGKLHEIVSIDGSDVPPDLMKSEFIAACDVDTPFCGKEGASFIFSPQKGADAHMTGLLEEGMVSFAGVIKRQYGIYLSEIPGSGAAGGVAGGLHALIGSRLVKGIEMLLDMAGFEELIKDADLIITGEGKADFQTLKGKVPAGVVKKAKKFDIPVICICGISEIDKDTATKAGFKEIVVIQPHPLNNEEMANAMIPETATQNIKTTISKYLRDFSNF